MPDSCARLHFDGSLIDHPLVGDSSSPSSFLSRTATTTLALGSREVLPQISASLRVRINVFVDRFLAHRRSPLQSPPLTDDLRRPSLSQSHLSILSHPLRKSPHPSSLPPRYCLLIGLLRPIAALSFIAPYLPANAAPCSSQSPRYLPDALANLSPSVY